MKKFHMMKQIVMHKYNIKLVFKQIGATLKLTSCKENKGI